MASRRPLVIIAPGNGCSPVETANWYKWLTAHLSKAGYTVALESFPSPLGAEEHIWLPFIGQLAAKRDYDLKHSVLVGHSSGAAAGLCLAEKQQLHGLVLVSAYTSDLGDELERRSGYFNRPFDWASQQANCGFISQFISDTDPFLPMTEQLAVRDGLSPKVEAVEISRGHYMEDDFPELLAHLLQRLEENPLREGCEGEPADAEAEGGAGAGAGKEGEAPVASTS